MDLRALKRNTGVHRALADSFKASFVRCWHRPLTEVEIATIESAPLCFSFMQLEAIELDLGRAESIKDANEIYRFLGSEVSSARGELIQVYEQQAAMAGLLQPAEQEKNLLVLEERLLAHAQKGASGA